MKKVFFILLLTAAVLSVKHSSAQILIPGFNASDQHVPVPFPGYDPDDPLGLKQLKPAEPYPFGGTVPGDFLPPDFPDPGPGPDNTQDIMNYLERLFNPGVSPEQIENIPGKDNSTIRLPDFTSTGGNLNVQPTRPNISTSPAIQQKPVDAAVKSLLIPIIPSSQVMVMVSISIF